MAEVPFQEGIDFLKGKVNLPTRRWDDLRHGAHARGFSVAGLTRDDMLADFRSAIEKARIQGAGFKEFRKDFDAIVERTGWKFFSHGKTDDERRAWRARIIYITNMRTSYMAGRYKQLTDPDVLKYRPWWQYVHSGALHPRKTHLSWDGMVLAASDPVWRVIYPPNGFGCGCDVEALSNRELKALGKTGPDPSPDLRPYEDKDPRTGQPETRYPGVDRGWEYNVGETWLSGMVPTELRAPLPPTGELPAPVDLPPMPEPRLADAADLLPDDLTGEDYVAAFLNRFPSQPPARTLKRKRDREQPPESAYRDKTGGIITVSRSLFEQRTPDGVVMGMKTGKRGRGRFAVFLADAVIDPDEIWVDWVELTSGFALRRAYLRRVVLPDGQQLFVRFEWTSRGWVAVTGFDTTEQYLQKFRKGALLFRRDE